MYDHRFLPFIKNPFYSIECEIQLIHLGFSFQIPKGINILILISQQEFSEYLLLSGTVPMAVRATELV